MHRHRPPVDDNSHDVLRLLLRAYGFNDTDDVDDRFLSAVPTPRLAAIVLTQMIKFVTPYLVLVKRLSSSLYMVIDDEWLGSAVTEGETSFL